MTAGNCTGKVTSLVFKISLICQLNAKAGFGLCHYYLKYFNIWIGMKNKVENFVC